MRHLLVIAVLAAACTNNDDVPGPLIGAVQPDHGPPGAVVGITGSFFCQLPDTSGEPPTCDVVGTVSFAASPGTVSTWTDSEIMAEVPQGVAGQVDVVVVVRGRTSNAVGFTIE